MRERENKEMKENRQDKKTENVKKYFHQFTNKIIVI